VSESASTALPFLVSSDARLQVGKYSYGRPKVLLWSDQDAVEIGAFCSIADGVTIYGGGEHNTDWVTTYPLRIAFQEPLAWKDGHPRPSDRTTKIGSDVWVGYGASILSGVTVGDGAVIGAHAVVATDVPPYAIVAGNPARLLRFRFPAEQIAALLEIRWWDWPIEKIRTYIPLLSTAQVDDLIAAARRADVGDSLR
jgi:acetyltransferase-like isoleucine patch superfamily enzyme